MKSTLLIFCALVGVSCVWGRELGRSPPICAKGQSYWCLNITTAGECGAVKHCIQSVWEHEKPIEVDRSEICQTCLDMVKQARDQLLSNLTQEEIKEVLEGTCKLVPIKIIREECIKLMDQFGPELVDTLASEMDPEVVCSVAGLCDNSRVHQLEIEYNKEKHHGKLNCNNCNSAVQGIRSKLNEISPSEFLNIFSKMCGKLGSYSDGCFDIAIKEHKLTLKWLRQNLKSKEVCNLAGACHSTSRHFVPVESETSLKVIIEEPNGDLPCELCEQLIQHVRDIMVANTTEEQFKLVLLGICNQMTVYKSECVNIVNEYYDLIYKFLVTELDGKILCQEIKLCPTSVISSSSDQFVRPLIAVDTEVEPESIQLPITRYNPIAYVPSSLLSNSGYNDQTLCSMCEYFLHFVQQEITLPSTEDKIKKIVEKGCARLPKSVTDQCKAFVETYMDEFVALLAQEIDPSVICPMLGVCPRGLVSYPYLDKPDCPLCLLSLQEVYAKLKNKNRTIEIISDVLDDLCIRDEFPSSLSIECVGFVVKNRKSIVNMVLTEFTPQESCTFINLCIPSELEIKPDNSAGDINTNEIKQNPDVDDANTCVLCEFIMEKIASLLKDKKTEEEIKDAVFHVCDIMPKSVTPRCRKFITDYADLVIELLVQELAPKQICTMLGLCPGAKELVQASMEKCLLCEVLMDALRTVLTDPNVDDDINVQLRLACHHIKGRLMETCFFFVEEVAPQIENALRTLPVGPLVCQRIRVCEEKAAVRTHAVPSRSKCLRGSAYWCISSAHAAMCNAIDYCQKEVWKGNKPRNSHLKGRVVISY